uniref:hypothetical protein n=1 Tax=Thaumasiovibrio occultus TaxID=1891184 RepID=UPI000B35A104|nr:hypothetical protein [Thaumasiovibrio occultus]
MKTSVIVQFDLNENKLDDLFSFEESLTQGLLQSKKGAVDGNDIGSEKYNIYIFPSGSYGPCVTTVIMWLKAKDLASNAVIAHTTKSGNIIVDFPKNHGEAFTYGI